MKIVDKKVICNFLDFIHEQKMNSSAVSYTAIKNALNVFSIPFPHEVIKAGTSLYRVRPHKGLNLSKENCFKRIQDVGHRTDLNNITNFGRANEPLQSVFYCSTERETSFFETTQLGRNCADIPVEIYTIGEWILQEDINVAHLSLNENDNQVANKLNEEFHELVNKLKSEGTINWLKVLGLFSKEFSKKSNQKGNDYLISCAFANYIYESKGVNNKTQKEVNIEGILYPSVQLTKKGMNLALKPSIIESQKLKLNKVVCQKMELVDNNYQETDTLESISIDYKNWLINWE